jgi:transmembrane protein EpsG
MTIMWINLSLVYMLSLLSRYFSRPLQNSPTYIRPNRILAFLVIGVLALVSGLQKNVGDTYFYMHSYKMKNFTWSQIDYSGDFGFEIFQLLLQKVSKDPQVLIFVTGIITNLLIISVLYKYARFIELALYMYITSGMFTTSMNGIRQFMAAGIVFIATKYLIGGNFKKYAIIILFASTIHKTALVLLPIYFIVRRKAWTKVTMLILASSILIVLGFNQFIDILFTAIENTKYSEYSNFSEGGANKLRIIVTAVPVFITFLGRHKLRELWPHSDYIVNLSIISVVFAIISSQNWIFARFNIYFGLYNLILISWVVLLFKENNQRLIYYLIIIFYFIYFYYEHVISFGFYYKSDYISF